MQRRSQVLIGLAVVALGIGAWALGLASGGAQVARVEDVLAQPARFDAGDHVLLGVPQPQRVPVSAAEGTVLRPNADWSNSTSSTVRWTDAQGNAWYSTRTLAVRDAGDLWQWHYSNETRRLPADPSPAFPPATVDWATGAAGHGVSEVFPIEAFHDATQDTPRIWGIYGGLLKDPMQPKPSQFTGHLVTALPDGRPMPDGAYVYDVQDFKAGCSSKFLPPQEKERLAQSGNLTA